jgi:hypothetical protein
MRVCGWVIPGFQGELKLPVCSFSGFQIGRKRPWENDFPGGEWTLWPGCAVIRGCRNDPYTLWQKKEGPKAPLFVLQI